MTKLVQTRRSFLTTLVSGASMLALTACGGGGNASGGSSAAAAGDGTDAKSDGVMTYAEYVAAEVDAPVMLECFVQAKQSWWEDKASIYAADADGAYFIYNAACDQATYDKLVEGAKISVKGYKAEWSGEVEVAEGAELALMDGSYIAEPVDVTDKLGTEGLIDFQNQKVAFTGLTIAASKDADGKEAPFIYNYDGSGAPGDDLYFNVSDGKATYAFTVESYLTGEDTDVYKLVSNDLKVGDTVDLEGFLYWYEGPNPHITSVTVK
ncbi:MAG: hypothetical protein J6D34_10805 [Atopobiaceae bacterium]|nr:hypothetical protein [Atopobiaceae bacterium]